MTRGRAFGRWPALMVGSVEFHRQEDAGGTSKAPDPATTDEPGTPPRAPEGRLPLAGLDTQRALTAAAGLLLVAVGGALDLVVFEQGRRHAIAYAALVLLTLWCTWQLTRRPPLVIAAGATAALWSLPHALPLLHLLAAGLLGMLLLVPQRAFENSPALVSMNIAGAVAGGVAFLLTRDPAVTLLALVTGGALAWVRPSHPTDEVLLGIRATALYLPGVLFAGLVVTNAVTGWVDGLPAKELLWLGAGLLGLASLLSLSLLGLHTLLSTQEPRQLHAWLAAAALVGVLAGSLLARDPSLTLQLTGLGLVPLALLATLFVGRWWAARQGPWTPMVLALPLVCVLAQWVFGQQVRLAILGG